MNTIEADEDAAEEADENMTMDPNAKTFAEKKKIFMKFAGKALKKDPNAGTYEWL